MPVMLGVTLVLFTCMFAVFGAAVSSDAQDNSVKFRLAFVGGGEDAYFQKGLEVVQAYDSSRFAIQTFQMGEQEALDALEKGKIDAYVLIPDGFIRDAMGGKIGSLKYVSTTGAADLSALFKDEITAVVSDIIIACEKAMYGIDDALHDHNMQEHSGRFSYDISLTYVDYILNRTDTYHVELLGIKDSLGFDGYMFSGLTVVLLTLAIVSLAPVFVKKEHETERLLKAKGIGPLAQVTGEFSALFLLCGLIVVAVSVISTITATKLPAALQRLVLMLSVDNLLPVLAVVFLITAFGYFLFQITTDFVSGVLLQFFVGISICFVSGCLYPLYFFPDSIQKLSGFLPQAYARSVFASCLIGQTAISQIIILVLHGILMLVSAWLIRTVRLGRKQG